MKCADCRAWREFKFIDQELIAADLAKVGICFEQRNTAGFSSMVAAHEQCNFGVKRFLTRAELSPCKKCGAKPDFHKDFVEETPFYYGYCQQCRITTPFKRTLYDAQDTWQEANKPTKQQTRK